MSFTWFALGVVVASLIASLSDWLFMGVLFHDKYLTYPEVWRPLGPNGEALKNGIASLTNVVTVGGMMALCYYFDARTFAGSLILAAGVWIVGPLPLLVINALYIKFHPLTVVAHALGWLAKLIVAAIAAVVFAGK